MRSIRQLLVLVFAVLVATSLLLASSLYSYQWYHRWRAQQLFKAVLVATPGVTSEVEYMRLVSPLRFHLSKMYQFEGDTGDSGLKELPGAFGIGNLPVWVVRSEALRFIPATVFWVEPKFNDDILSSLRVSEYQGSGHPFGATVTLTATRFEGKLDPLTFDSSGYQVQELKHKATDKSWETIIYLDERATSAQRSAALSLRFNCFTDWHWCTQADDYFHPLSKVPIDVDEQ